MYNNRLSSKSLNVVLCNWQSLTSRAICESFSIMCHSFLHLFLHRQNHRSSERLANAFFLHPFETSTIRYNIYPPFLRTSYIGPIAGAHAKIRPAETQSMAHGSAGRLVGWSMRFFFLSPRNHPEK